MQRVEFPGALGDMLAARLDLPAGAIRGCAIFAHCFTCSKDSHAASRISRALAERGIAVLRFDFTGLGESEGDFAATNFTSNVDDLVAAAAYLREHFEAPTLLVGHSLGGAAVLRAAHDIPEVKAVATIGAPFDPGHVKHLFGDAAAPIAAGEARDVVLAGRRFRIRPQFLEDISNADAPSYIGKLRRPLLIFHGPRDQIVGIDNATQIFKAARHSKSFISLDDADHLITREEDAEHIAAVLCAWASRYAMHDAAGAEVEAGVVTVQETGTGKYSHLVQAGPHTLLADEPQSHDGDDRGPSPYQLLLAALGACTSMTMRMYADRKGWKIGRLGVQLSHAKIHAEDCHDCAEGATGRIDRIERNLFVEGELEPEQLDKLREIANKCPVHRTLENKPHVVTKWR